MDVLNFFTHLRGEDGHWSGWERDELSRLKVASAVVLENQIWEDGVTDNGDPWIVAVDEDSLELSLHVARLSGAYVAVSGDLAPVASGANLKSVVNDCLTYIRSIRHEAISNDGATIRMPIGVSAAAFGIFLTERMTAYDDPQGQTKIHQQLSKLGLDPNDSFLFSSSLATSPQTQDSDDQVAFSPVVEKLPGADEAISNFFENDGVDQITVVEVQLPKHKANDAKEIDVASVAIKSSASAKLPALTEPTSDQTANVPLLNADVSTSEGAQPVEGGEAPIVVTSPAQMTVGEDQVVEEVAPEQPKTNAEPIDVSTAVTVAASASPKAAGPSFRAAAVEPEEYNHDTFPLNLSRLDLEPSLSQDVERLAGIWPAPDISDDVFQI